jgi:tetratricopeptide (TPR) repeat protein
VLFRSAKVLSYNPEDKNLLNEIANNYYIYKRYEGAAKTWAKMIDLGKNEVTDYMQIGRAYYSGENYKTADSVFSLIINKSPNYLPAYLFTARTYFKLDPDYKLGLAKPKFEKLIEVAKADSVKNNSEMMEAFGYLSYYNMTNDNYSRAKDYYLRMINLDANNKDNKIRGYNGLGSLDYNMAGKEKTIEGRLPYLAKAQDSYSKTLALDPNNSSAKNMLKVVQDFEAQVKKGINPNEIKGTVKNAAGQPIAYASIRIKDTAAEMMSKPNGEFKFEIPQGSEVLVISANGYKTVEIPITKSRVYPVILTK